MLDDGLLGPISVLSTQTISAATPMSINLPPFTSVFPRMVRFVKSRHSEEDYEKVWSYDPFDEHHDGLITNMTRGKSLSIGAAALASALSGEQPRDVSVRWLSSVGFKLTGVAKDARVLN